MGTDIIKHEIRAKIKALGPEPKAEPNFDFETAEMLDHNLYLNLIRYDENQDGE